MTLDFVTLEAPRTHADEIATSTAEYLTFAAAGGQSETSDIFPDNEPEETAVIRQYLTTAALGEQ